MGYNKKILSEATKKLDKPQKIKNKNTAEVQNTFPFESSKGFLNGPPPPGTNYRIPGNSIYNPTPYNILARGSNGQEKVIAAGDTSVQNFGDADYVDEFQIAKKGGEKKFSRSLSATNKLFKKNPLVKAKKKKNKKTFDPNAKYYQEGGYVDLDLDDDEILELQKGGYIVEYLDDPSIPELTKAQRGGQRPILYVDPNDPAGREKYQASADSMFLYNKGLEAKNYYEKLKPIFDKMNLSGNYSTKDFSELAKKYELKQNHHKRRIYAR